MANCKHEHLVSVSWYTSCIIDGAQLNGRVTRGTELRIMAMNIHCLILKLFGGYRNIYFGIWLLEADDWRSEFRVDDKQMIL